MSTIDSLPIIATMLSNDGRFFEDPAAFAIYQYKNVFNGGQAFKVCRTEDDEVNFLFNGAYKGTPVCMFRAGKLTKNGNDWLTRYGNKNVARS